MVRRAALGSEANQEGLTGPRTASGRRVQPIGSNESAPRVGQILQNLDTKLCGGEDFVSVLNSSQLGAR